MTPDWICCQIGAREHYAIPRALHRRGRLARLITDCWVAPGSWDASSIAGALRGRFHPDLQGASVTSWTMRYAGFEARSRLLLRRGWQQTMCRNEWFQQQALAEMRRLPVAASSGRTLFSYSYAARNLFAYAKARGWRTILGQMDPGPAEERIVSGLRAATPSLAGSWEAAPAIYWERWKAECELADIVVVNSAWSQECLLAEGVPAPKLCVVPLAYEEVDMDYERSYPAAFSTSRPLRVLFLGQVNLRKGIALLLEAMRRLRDAQVEFWIVGDIQASIPAEMMALGTVRWIGPCPRSEVHRYYRDADVFVFPTHSDGFGLTQLEARRWRLPVIASRNCGQVVEDGVSGMVLAGPTADQLTDALRFCLANPGQLSRWARKSPATSQFGIDELANTLVDLR